MNEAAELFWRAIDRFPRPGDAEAQRLLSQAAILWRQAGCRFNAGFAMTKAIKAAWGTSGGVQACAEEALDDFRRCELEVPPCSPGSLLSLHRRALELHRYVPDAPAGGLWEEIGGRLRRFYADSPNADSYLVRGVIFKSDLDGEWEPGFPPYEVEAGAEWWTGNQVMTISFPSAFHIFVWLTDYQAAHEIAQRFPDAFVTPGLRGWRAAVRGFVAPDEAPERFAEAAEAFAEDLMPSSEEWMQRGRSWSSKNIDLWAKFFRARHALALAARDPTRVSECIKRAALSVQGTDSGWVDGGVSRFRILVQTLARLLGEEAGLSPAEARVQFLQKGRLFGQQPTDEVSLRFISLVGEAFEGFRADPAREITTGRLPAALDTLLRIPLLGPEVSAAITPAIGARAVAAIIKPDHSWVYRTLEGITDEAKFRTIILRLLQSAPSPTAYAHIRHGPVEYGKDIAVLLEEDGRSVLRMYQAKCGEMTLAAWREARFQLEEMYQVDLSSFQLPTTPDERQGILICNAHANPFAEPAMQGWFVEQDRDHARSFRFMHLDDVVKWIDSQRLYGTFRSACAELGLPTA